MRPVILIGALGLVVGVTLGSLTGSLGIVWAAVAVLGAWFLILAWWGIGSARKAFMLGAVCALAVALGLARVELARPSSSDGLALRVGQTVTLRGMVVTAPEAGDAWQQIVLRPDGQRERLLIFAPLYPEFDYGDEITVTGELERPEAFVGSSGTLFDYPLYLASRGIFYRMFNPGMARLDQDQGNWLIAALFDLKSAWLDSLNRFLPEPDSSLAAGVLLGERHGLGEAGEEIFRRAGLSHILVLSGYNITVVLEAVGRVTKFLPRLWRLIPGFLALGLFVVMVGSGASVVRAGLMGAILLLARATGRFYDAGWALVLVAAAMILHNPFILFGDPGFQLSFLATAGLIYFTPILEQWMKNWPRLWGVKSILITTMAAQTAVLPLIWRQFAEWSAVALPANLLILLSVPAAMFLAFVVGGLGASGLTVLAAVAAVPAHLLFLYQLVVAKWFSVLPGAALSVLPPPGLLIAIIYLGLALGVWRWTVGQRRLRRQTALL